MTDQPAPMTTAALTERVDQLVASHLNALDALVADYMAGAARCSTDRQAKLRSPRAAWCAVLSHAEHRIHQANRAAATAKERA